MKFERVLVHAFGTLEALDTSEDLPGLVVVLGPNESGKSTLFEALTTSLYGFRPAQRDRHPHSPWNGATPEVTAWIRREDDSVVEVRRRLKKSASGRLVEGTAESAIRNRPIPDVERVPRDLFRQVFALTLSELAQLDEEAWDQLQERLLAGMGARDLILARSAAETLEDEAGQLWRPTRRGNQEIRECRKRIGEHSALRREAVDRDRRTRRLHAERDQARSQLGALRDDRERTRSVVERASVLRPLKARLDRLAQLEATAEDGPSLEGLPSDPGERLRELDGVEARIAEERSRIREAEAGPGEALTRLTATHKLALGLRKEIGECQTAAAEAESARTRIAQLEQEMNDLDRRVAAVAREVFTRPIDDEAGVYLDNLAVGDLGSRVDRLLDTRRRVELQNMRRGSAPAPAASWEAPLGFALVILGIALIGLSTGRPTSVAGALTAAAGAALLARWWARRPTGPDHSDTAGTADLEAAEVSVEELLGPLPLHSRPRDRELVAQLTRIQELRSDRQVRALALEEGHTSVRAAAQKVAELGRRLGLPLPAHPGPAAHQLDRFLTKAERADEAAEGAERELARLAREVEDLEERAARLESDRSELLTRLGEHGDGDTDRGLGSVERRIEAAAEAVRVRRELDREYPDLPRLEARIREAEAEGEPWLTSDDALMEARRHVESLTEQIERVAAEEEGATRDLRHLATMMTTDEVDGQIAAMEEEGRQLILEHDRKAVLAALLRAADRRFREENEPDVLRKASEHLARITQGRYTELVTGDPAQGPNLQVVDPESGRWVEVERLSSGAREQVYLSLRLAAMDHLDEGGERLPVFVDEAFVNWDPDRRGRVLGLIRDLAQHRQVIVFTCQPEWASALVEQGGRLVSLESES